MQNSICFLHYSPQCTAKDHMGKTEQSLYFLLSEVKDLRSQSPPSFSPPPLPYLLECCFTSWLRWEETNDWLASLAVIGCLCMEAILGDNRFFNTFYRQCSILCL